MASKIFLVCTAVLLPVVLGRTIDLKSLTDVAPLMVCEDKPADIVFIIDESSSIYYRDFQSQVNFVMGLAPRFNIDAGDIKLGVLSFSNTTEIRFHLGAVASLEEMTYEMAKINKTQKYGGRTLTYDAIDKVVNEMFTPKHARAGVPRIIVLITDGQSDDLDRTAAAADRARAAGITMFAIGVGKNMRTELEAIANDPDEEYVFEVTSYNVLEAIAGKLVKRACKIITTTPPPSIEGCEERELVDVMFGLPDRAGIEGTNYAIEFVNNFAARSHMGPVRIGVTPRLCYPEEPINLGDHSSREGFIMALGERRSNKADIHEHIRYIRTSSGAYEQAKKFAILIIDSQFSNREETLKQAQLAKNAEIHLVVIGVGEHVSASELESIAGSEESVLVIGDYSQLQSGVDLVVSEMCKGMENEYSYYTGDYDIPAFRET